MDEMDEIEREIISHDIGDEEELIEGLKNWQRADRYRDSKAMALGSMKTEVLKTLSNLDVNKALSNEKCSECNYLGYGYSAKCKRLCEKGKKEGFSNMEFTRNCCLIIFILIIVFLFKKEIMNFLK